MRGGYVMMDRWVGVRKDQWMCGRDAWKDGHMDAWMDVWVDRASELRGAVQLNIPLPLQVNRGVSGGGGGLKTTVRWLPPLRVPGALYPLGGV